MTLIFNIQDPRLVVPKEKTNEVCNETANNIADFKVQHGEKSPIEICDHLMVEMVELLVIQSISYARFQNDQQFTINKTECANSLASFSYQVITRFLKST